MSEHEGEKVRRKLIYTLARLSRRWPQLRVCQLIGNAVPDRGDWPGRPQDLFYVEDSQLLQWLLKFEKMADAPRRVGGPW